jgi:hypothetical protein
VAFANAAICGNCYLTNNTYTGSATGIKYTALLNGVIHTNGGTLPGSVAGSTATGGQYT